MSAQGSTLTPRERARQIAVPPRGRGTPMVEKTIELTGSSTESIEHAVDLAVARAAVTISGVHTAQVTNIAAEVAHNKVSRWKVTVKLTFQVKEQLHE
jgi:flavin-binding protein dodecin